MKVDLMLSQEMHLGSLSPIRKMYDTSILMVGSCWFCSLASHPIDKSKQRWGVTTVFHPKYKLYLTIT
jgi:hypothetical protein